MDLECFRVNNQVICLDLFAYNVINITERKYECLLTAEEFHQRLDEVHKNGEKLIVEEIEKHRFKPRTYYRIYRIQLSLYRYKYFMEIFDGISASYRYVFCSAKKRCLEVMQKTNKVMK